MNYACARECSIRRLKSPATDRGRSKPFEMTITWRENAAEHAVDRKANPEFTDLIEAFENITGTRGVLNTSFNLHGEPIVCSARDAFRVFESSGIDDLLINHTLISK